MTAKINDPNPSGSLAMDSPEGFIPLDSLSSSARYSFENLHPEMIVDPPKKEPTFEDLKKQLPSIFNKVEEAFNYYLEAPADTIGLLSLWTLSSYFINCFPTFPVLYLNAMRGSGKSRTLNLISHLGYGQPSQVQNNISESSLFHTRNEVLCIDEFEPKATERNNLLLLLNSCYKRGTCVSRMKKVKKTGEESFQKETHSIYLPVAIANINGLDGVLQDRALIIFLEKSFNQVKTSRIEDLDTRLTELKRTLVTVVTPMTVMTAFGSIINGWNQYIDMFQTGVTTVTPSQPSQEEKTLLKSELLDFYDKIYKSGIKGRSLEICFPLLIVASLLNEDLFNYFLGIFSKVSKKRRENEVDDVHVLILRFIAALNEPLEPYTPSGLYEQFQNHFVSQDIGLNLLSFIGALNRLQLVKKRQRTGSKRLIHLDIERAKSRIGLFDSEAST